jgi:energy-coupling factor transporter ATP-binding protein EcfA2
VAPVVVFGPEGCGKTAWLKQAAEILLRERLRGRLRQPPAERVLTHTVSKEVAETLAEIALRALGARRGRARLGSLQRVRELLKLRKRKVAVWLDDVFQAIGLNQAASYVKGLLNMIEYTP